LERQSGRWRTSTGAEANAPWLRAHFLECGYKRWVVQAFIRGNEDLAALSNTSALQTIRVVTVAESAARARILAGRLRLIAGDSPHANLDLGRAGNLVANLDVESGRIRNVVRGGGHRPSIRLIEDHPITGRRLIDFVVPRWDEAKSLA